MFISKRDIEIVSGTTPVGTVIWAQVAVPNRKFKEHGEYAVKLRIHEGQAQSLIKTMKGVIANKLEETKKDRNFRGEAKLKRVQCWELEYDDSGETGFVLFRFKALASGITKDGREWTRTIPVFQSDGEPILPIPNIPPGSEVKVAYELRPFSSPVAGIGCACRLLAVQVFKMAPSVNKRTAEDFGFSMDGVSLHFSSGSSGAADLEYVTALFEN